MLNPAPLYGPVTTLTNKSKPWGFQTNNQELITGNGSDPIAFLPSAFRMDAMGRWLWAVAMVSVWVGCAPPPAREGHFSSPDPAAKLYAIHRAGEQRDWSTIRSLIEQLDSSDGLVRMMAIQALQRITGTRYGFVPYGTQLQRRVAVERWTQAVRDGEFDSPVDTNEKGDG